MDNRILSQEEIELLLKGELPNDEDLADSSNEALTDIEIDAVGEISNISMGAAATALSQLVNKKVEITTPQVNSIRSQDVGIEFPDPAIMVTVNYKTGIEGSNFFILSQRDSAIIFDLMIGGDGLNPAGELNEMQISAISEAMNQMMGSAATAMSTMFNLKVDITPPEVVVTNLSTDNEVANLLKQVEPLVRISFRLHIENVIDSVLAQVIPLRIAKDMVSNLMKDPVVAETPVTVNKPSSTTISRAATPQQQSVKHVSPSYKKDVVETTIQPAEFSTLQPINTGMLPENLELILDVPLQVSVELGKARKTIREIMNLGPGAVIELDKVAGEPVDMVVNGKLIAKCEVVVINETFGIRITDIVNPAERLKTVN